MTNQVLVIGHRQAIQVCDGSPAEPLCTVRGTCLGGSFRLTQG